MRHNAYFIVLGPSRCMPDFWLGEKQRDRALSGSASLPSW